MDSIMALCTAWIEAGQERVWRAVTEAPQLSLWYSPGSPWEIPQLQVGAVVYFHHSPNKSHTGEEVVTMEARIEAVDPLHKFSLRWELESPEYEMVTHFILSGENGGTRVTITESGYETPEQAKPTEEGYAMSLENLRAHLEGRSLPY